MVAFDWHLDANWQPNPKLATTVVVRFSRITKGSRIELEHRDLEKLGAQAEATRTNLDGSGGWADLLLGSARLGEKG
jgi:hypothetical protein